MRILFSLQQEKIFISVTSIVFGLEERLNSRRSDIIEYLDNGN